MTVRVLAYVGLVSRWKTQCCTIFTFGDQGLECLDGERDVTGRIASSSTACILVDDELPPSRAAATSTIPSCVLTFEHPCSCRPCACHLLVV